MLLIKIYLFILFNMTVSSLWSHKNMTLKYFRTIRSIKYIIIHSCNIGILQLFHIGISEYLSAHPWSRRRSADCTPPVRTRYNASMISHIPRLVELYRIFRRVSITPCSLRGEQREPTALNHDPRRFVLHTPNFLFIFKLSTKI